MANLAFIIRRKNKQQLSHKGNQKENIIQLDLKKGFVHCLAKFILAWQTLKENKYFITDPVFKNEKKSDVLVLDDSIIYNIIYSDTVPEYMEQEKDSVYPFTVQPLNAKKIIENGLDLYLPSSWSIKAKKKKQTKK